jgi:hypothetical protein
VSQLQTNVEDVLILDKFQVRWYQKEIWQALMDAIDNKKGAPRNFLVCAPRRSGKDILSWNAVLRMALSQRCLIQYYFPTYGLARRVILEGITNDGDRFMDFIPKRLIANINQTLLRITLVNGSIISLHGALDFSKKAIGVNPKMIVFSEYSKYPSDEAFLYANPILAANSGICLIISTPSGPNFQYHLHEMARELPSWKTIHQKTSEIQHIPTEVLIQQRQLLGEEIYMQEYECSYSRGIQSVVYGKDLERMEQNGRIAPLFYDPAMLVHTVMDIGVSDSTAILWFTVTRDGNVINIIDCYSSNDIGLPTYIKIIKDKPYNYGLHFLPADGAVREWGADGQSRRSIASNLGIDFHILDQEKRVSEGIETVKVMMNKMYIDSERCKSLIEALENYRRKWNEERKIYEGILKTWSSHYADAFRYLCRAIPFTTQSMSGEEFDRQRHEALYGSRYDFLRRIDRGY